MTTDHLDAPPATAARQDRSTLALVGSSALVLFVTIWVDAPQAPAPGASGARIRSFLEANLDRIGFAVMAATVAFAAMLVLTVALWRLVAETGAGQSFAAVMLLVSGTLSALWLAVVASVNLVPVVAADDAGKLGGYSDQTLLSLDLINRLQETFGDVATVPRGFFLVSIGLLVVRQKVLPRWTGHLALVIGVASLVGILATALDDGIAVLWLVGLFGFALWMPIVGIASLVRLLRARLRG